MAQTTLQSEDGIGLPASIAAHVALVLVLVYGLQLTRNPPPIERITVSLAGDVGLTSTSPDPNANAAPDAGPELGEVPPIPEPDVAPSPSPSPRVTPSPMERPKPTPRVMSSSRPTARATPRPQPRAAPTASPARQPQRPQGASRFGDAFKDGVPGAQQNGSSRTPPGAQAGPAVRTSLVGAISREIKPFWTVPQGVDAERLVTILSWDLNPDGTLAGTPRVVRQEGITEANRPQAARHAEQAIRAVQRAAPFDLPPQYYDAWKRVSSFRFDMRLSL